MSVLTFDQPIPRPPDPNVPEEVRRARFQATVEKLFGPSDEKAEFAVSVIFAQGDALAWVRDQLGVYPCPRPIAERLQDLATELKAKVYDGGLANVAGIDPAEVLGQAARDLLAEYRATQLP
jgi:hypothetical protein